MLRLKLLVIALIIIYLLLNLSSLVQYAKLLVNDVNNTNLDKINKRVLYFSVHGGTIDEMSYVLTSRNINFTVSSYDMLKKHGYAISEKLADQIIKSGQIKKICDEFDLIIIGDTIPLGRAFIQAGPSICRSKLALQITNRYDFAIYDRKSYNNLITNQIKNPNVYWLPNNDYELYYLNMNGIEPPEQRTMMIRPFGVCYHFKSRVSLRKTIIYTQYLINFMKNLFKKEKLPNYKFEIYSGPRYGGPLTAKQHKLFVYIPYQVSTMKVFQNANYRVLTAIPTPRFYKEIIKMDKSKVIPEVVSLIEKVSDWTEYFDVYNSKYIDMFIQFDNWNELIDLINEKNMKTHMARQHNRMKRIMNMHWQENQQKWNDFFKTVL